MTMCVKECRIEHGEIVHAPGCATSPSPILENLTDAELETLAGDEIPRGVQPRLMSLDEARILVARQLNSVLAGAIEAVAAAQKNDPTPESNEHKNGTLMRIAAQEFVQGNALLIKKLERPTILRPGQRSMARVRPLVGRSH